MLLSSLESGNKILKTFTCSKNLFFYIFHD